MDSQQAVFNLMLIFGCLFVKSCLGLSDFVIDTSGCGKIKGCLREKGSCLADQCKFILTWRQRENRTVDFEFSAQTNADIPWIAVGFSNDTEMPQTSVVDCIVNVSDNNQVIIQSSYNPGHYNKVLKNNQLGLVPGQSNAVYSNGRLSCNFTRIMHIDQSIAEADKVFTLGVPYYIFLGRGPANETGEKKMHTDIPYISSRKISTSDIVDVSTSNFLILHASFMIVAWMLISTIGVVVSRHYKNVFSLRICSEKVWFQVHRSAMILAFLLSATATILIFVELSAVPLLAKKLHPILGMILLCLMSLNIIIGISRPSSGSDKRPLFNWVHCIIGNGTHLTAVVVMFFGVQSLAERMAVSPWLQWVVVGYGAWRVLIDIILTLERFYNKEDLRVAYVEMSGSGSDIVIERNALHFKQTMFGVYVFVVTGLTGVTLYGVISAF